MYHYFTTGHEILSDIDKHQNSKQISLFFDWHRTLSSLHLYYQNKLAEFTDLSPLAVE